MPNKQSLFTKKQKPNLPGLLLVALIATVQAATLIKAAILRNKKANKVSVLIIASSLTLANSVFANEIPEEKHYEIEIIVFANTDADNINAETWDEKPKLPNITNNVALVNSFDLLDDDAIDQLPLFYIEPDFASNDTFSKYLARLKKNAKYDILLHRVWRQTVPQNSSGLPVYITSKSDDSLFQPIEELTLEQRNIETAEDIVTAEQLEIGTSADNPELLFLLALEEEQQMIDAMIAQEEQSSPDPLDPIIPFDEDPTVPEAKPVNLSPIGPPQHKIYGTFRLSKSRFMHMSLDFIYRDQENLTEFTLYPPASPAELESVEGFPEFYLNEENSFLIDDEINQQPSEENLEIATLEEVITTETIEPPTNNEIALATDEEAEQPEQERTEDFLALEKPPFPGYRLVDSKRVRLAKVYYFDHPMFGIIARIIRYKQPKEEIAGATR